jgi:hypothetical protein
MEVLLKIGRGGGLICGCHEGLQQMSEKVGSLKWSLKSETVGILVGRAVSGVSMKVVARSVVCMEWGCKAEATVRHSREGRRSLARGLISPALAARQRK